MEEPAKYSVINKDYDIYRVEYKGNIYIYHKPKTSWFFFKCHVCKKWYPFTDYRIIEVKRRQPNSIMFFEMRKEFSITCRKCNWRLFEAQVEYETKQAHKAVWCDKGEKL